MYDFEIYTGKDMKLEGDLGTSGNIVLRLTKDIEGNRDHKVYFDNWFSSVELVKTLKDRGIRAVGTSCWNDQKESFGWMQTCIRQGDEKER